MGVYGCVWVYWCTITIKQGEMNTGGGVDMHDLGSRVAGKFPGASCAHAFCQKIVKTKRNHTEHESGAA